MAPAVDPIESILAAAVEIASDAERRAYVDQACAGDAERKRRVEELIGNHFRAGSFLESPAPDLGATTDPPVAERPGTVIGPYKLLEQIGEGGFGVVYLAEQTQPVRRKVALKILKPGMDTRQVVARFEAERQALAIMDHPNIAKVFDGGATATGRPYFVMELVKGIPITEYSDQNHLTTRQRLELFLLVCQAVQHAHQKGIIHRDLKPSNVMVSRHDTTPVVKVIDFGVAKALGQELTDKTLFTGLAQMIGTPLYMSPEQAGMSDLDVDTRSDIYSLGVLLYELLTGTTPFRKERFQKAAYDEIRRIIREEEPPKPSTRLSESTETLPTISAQRHTDPAKLTKLMRGELDWIVMKALEKDRNRRYETANGFAMDVQRYLADEPVLACPPSVRYRVRKFARLNKARLAVAGLVLFFLVLLGGGAGWMLSDRSNRMAVTASQVREALGESEEMYRQGMLPEAITVAQKAQGLLQSGGGSVELQVRVRQWLIDLNTVMKLEERRLEWNDHEDRDRMHTDFARLFREYGIDTDSPTTEESASRVAASHIKLDLVVALDFWATRLRFDAPRQNPERWQRLLTISRAADADPWRLRLLDATETKDLRALRELVNGADLGRLRTQMLASLGDSLTDAGDPEAAVAFLRKAQKRHPADHNISATLATALASVKPPRHDEQIAFRRIAVALRPSSPAAHNSLGAILHNSDPDTKDRCEEARVEFLEAIRLKPDYAIAHTNLGIVLHTLSKLLKQDAILDEAIAAHRTAISLTPDDAWMHTSLGHALLDKGLLEDAIAAYGEAVRLESDNAVAHTTLGVALLQKGQLDQAIACHHKAIHLKPDYPEAHTNLGVALQKKGQLDEAIACHHKAIRLKPDYAAAHYNLGSALRAQNKLEQALDAYLETIRLKPDCAEAHNNRGLVLADQKKWDEAIAAYEQAIRINPNLKQAHHNLGNALKAQNKFDDAIKAYREAIRLEPDSAETHLTLGNALLAQNKLEQALDAYRESIRLKPDFPAAHTALGIVLQRQKRFKEAFDSYRKAIDLDPKYATARDNLIRCFLAEGRLDEAVAACREASKVLDLQDANVRRIFGNSLNATAWRLVMHPDPKARKPAIAVELAKEEVRLSPQPRWHTLGVAHYRAGEWRAAVAALEQSIKTQGYQAANWFVLAMAHDRLGNKDEARECYDKAVAWMNEKKLKDGDLLRFRAEASELLGVAVKGAVEIAPAPREVK